MVNKATILDIGWITAFISNYDDCDHLLIRNLIVTPEHSVFVSPEKDIVAISFELYPSVAEVHVYSSPQARGQKLVQFLKDCIDLDEHTSYILPCTSREAEALARYFRAKVIGYTGQYKVFIYKKKEDSNGTHSGTCCSRVCSC